MRIYSKKTFALGPGAIRNSDSIDLFITKPLTFQDLPDKYTKDKTFIRAVRCHDIEIIDNGVTEKGVDGTSAPIVDKPVEEVKTEEVKKVDENEFYNELKAMNREETLKVASEKGIAVEDGEELKKIKSKIMKAFKEENV